MTSLDALSKIPAFLLMGSFLLIGCSSFKRPVPSNYSLLLHNTTQAELTNTHVYYGDGFKSVGGILIPHAKAFHHFVRVPIPEVANVTWRDAADIRHDVAVDVLQALPPKAFWDNSFCIVFAIREGDRVDVLYQSEEMYNKRCKHYWTRFYNASTGQVNHVEAIYGRYHSVAGMIDPQGGSYEQFLPEPLPDAATVRWIDLQGRNHSVDINLPQALGSNPKESRIVLFTIQNGGRVTAECEGG